MEIVDNKIGKQFRRQKRRESGRGVLLVLPAFLFLLVVFVVPIGLMTIRAFDNAETAALLPRTAEGLKSWNGVGPPPPEAFAGFTQDLRQATADRSVGALARALNQQSDGLRTLVMKTSRALPDTELSNAADALVAIDSRWREADVWFALKRASASLTLTHFAKAADLEYGADGKITPLGPSEKLFQWVFLRTFAIAATVTLISILLGYPVAYLLAASSGVRRRVVMMFVVIPLATSILVRAIAWLVLLQTHGLVNDALRLIGIISEPAQLLHTRTATILSMVHIQLPFIILPIFAVMTTISPNYVRAARSLGAGPIVTFLRIYLPLSMPGVAAGGLITFILSLGHYIIPALVGGSTDQMVSYYVALYTNRELNWGLASALGIILLVATIVMYGAFVRLIGADRVSLVPR
ncbi:ABC transporter permease [Mesorhizobium caraganae]|uniref:ABC transporter permease n=1 Tax=Mesorhizobium caraganae TaxID=483206 RepID=UPI001939C1FE|nr:ABC transporter permease [Mesorhizobium caraganae]MBM2715024.1 ABC transporter permease [Mesorhizobium caraganae]